MSGEKYGYVDANDKVIIKPQFDEAYEFRDGYAPVKKNEKFGMIDSSGNEVIAFKYKDLGYLQEGLIIATSNGIKFGFINIKSEIVIPFIYDNCYNFLNNFAIVKIKGKYGMINKKNIMVVPCKYVSMENMEGGIAKVCAKSDGVNDIGVVNYDNYWGFVNDKGVEITKMNCGKSSTFNLGNGFAVARTSWANGDGYDYLIDKNGKIKIPQSKELTLYKTNNNKYLKVSKRINGWEKFGFVNYEGKELFPVNFDKIYDFKWVTDDKYLAEAIVNQQTSFYINEEFKCVEFNNKKCPEY